MGKKHLFFSIHDMLSYKSLLLLVLFNLLSVYSDAQTKFIEYGHITFERSQNQYQLLGEEKINSSVFMQEYAKSLPKILKDEYVLDFDSRRSSYKWLKELQENKTFWEITKPSKEDKIVMDFSSQRVNAYKVLGGDQFLIEDTIRNYRWKILDEVRSIAGFDCRKAVTTICDSVVVVAFYTDEIPVSSGPENFNGLPGMILGLAIPRLYTTWFATKLELIAPSNDLFEIRSRKKKISDTDFINNAKKIVSKLEEYGDRKFWEMVL